MCGFVGYIDGGETQLMEPVLHAMADRIRHRGPDDADYYMDGEISLGFRRLSIIDLEGGRQPILNEDKSKVLMFNGEIYNYQSLREDLLKAGHVFTTKTDSEVLLHGFEEYGTDLLNKLRGMFAFIIWDKNTKTLFGARDYFGIKPFYYAKMQGTLMFGSEIKSFVEHPHFKRELNERALEGYLSFQYSPGYETFFKNVYKLPPAHYFFYKDGKMDMQRYWIPEFNAEEDKPLEYWVDEIEKTFDDSVNAHKIADVEVGSFLSSGVDSSYVACSADVDKTFTVGFDNGEKYNEISYAKELSELIPVKNYSKTITPEEFWGNFGKIQYYLVGKFKLPPFIATLGTMFIARGIAYIVNNNRNTDNIASGIGKEAGDRFQNIFYYGKTAGIFNTFWIALIIFLIFWFFLARTRSGRHIDAIGSNVDAARLSGVDVVKTTMKAYMVSGFCSAIVGFVLCAQAGMGNMDAGNMYEMYGVAAGVIGGVSPLGGSGILLGTFAGAGVWQTLENGLNLIHAQVGFQRIIIGVIVVGAVLLDVVVRSGNFKKKKSK